MIVQLPKSATHSRVEIIVEHAPTQFRSGSIADIRAMSEIEIETPAGVAVTELDVTARFCNARGQHDEGMGVEVIQAAKAPEEPEEPGEETPPAGEIGEASEAGKAEPTDEELEALTQPSDPE